MNEDALAKRRTLIALTILIGIIACNSPEVSLRPIVRTAEEWNAWPWGPIHRNEGITISEARVATQGDSSGRHAAFVTFVNTRSSPDTVMYGACSFSVRLYGDSSLTVPVWDNRPPPNSDCVAIGYLVPLRAGESREAQVSSFSERATLQSLPSGRYFAAIVYKLFPSGTPPIVVLAGAVQLPSAGPR